MSKNDGKRGSMVGRDPRGSMVGAPPTKSTPTAGFGGGRSFLKVNPPKREKPAEPVVVNYESESEEEEEDTAEDTPELEQPASSSSKTAQDKAQDKEDNKSPVEEKPKRKRKKRRLRLTDGLKSKKRAERKEKQQAAVEKKEAPDSDADVPPESPSKKEKEVPEEEVIKAPPSLTTYTPFQLLCDSLLRKLIAKDPEEFFANPVLASTAPDYLSVISNPMDFSSMRRKVESNEYGCIADFKADVQLVVDNAMTYNPPNSIHHLAASKLAVVSKYYLSDQYLTYLRYSLPFGKDIPMELMGLNKTAASANGKNGSDGVRKGTTKALNAISDNVGSKDLMKMAEKDLKDRLTSRLPNCQLGYLDNKDGALALNVLTGAEKSKITLGDFVKKLDKGNPGICTPAEPRLCVDYPITYTNAGPFSSFAPQFDSTWATLSKRDSDLLTACYGDQANAAEAIALRQMVADSGDSILGIVDGFLDTLTDGEHSRTIKELKKGPTNAARSTPLNELLEDVKSLENIGLDLSFVNDLKVDLGLAPKPKLSVEQQLRKTGRMVTDLAGLNYNRLSNQPGVTLTDTAALSSVEVQLADSVLDEFGKEINGLNVKPGDLVSSKVIHESLGLNDDDYDVLREFMVV